MSEYGRCCCPACKSPDLAVYDREIHETYWKNRRAEFIGKLVWDWKAMMWKDKESKSKDEEVVDTEKSDVGPCQVKMKSPITDDGPLPGWIITNMSLGDMDAEPCTPDAPTFVKREG